MTNFLSPRVAKAAVADTGSKFASVEFVKKNGDRREIRGLFRPTSKMVGGDGGQMASKRLKANGLIAIWSPDIAREAGDPMRGWRSIREGAITAIRTEGKTYTAG